MNQESISSLNQGDGRKRILIVADSVKRKTGYATVARNILKNLYNLDRYKFAQLGLADIPTQLEIPIQYYSNIKNHSACCGRGRVIEFVEEGSDQVQFLNLDPFCELNKNQTQCKKAGNEESDAYGYDSVYFVVEHFKPDIVIPINDLWGLYNIQHLKNRKNFKFVPYLAIDSECLFPSIAAPAERPGLPQIDSVQIISGADKPIVFTKWATNVINDTAQTVIGKKIDSLEIIPHGVDTSVWKPLPNKDFLREKYFGIKPGNKVFLIGCFLKDTPILMSDLTYKPIQDIQANDKIINHLGEEDIVVAPDPKEYSGNLITLNVAGCLDPITSTGEHPFYVFSSKKLKSHELLSETINNGTYEWKKACDITKDDWLCEPISYITTDIECLDTTKIEVKQQSAKKLPDRIPVDEEFMRYLGLFVAEGSFQYSWARGKKYDASLYFNFNSHEEELISFVETYSKKLGVHTNRRTVYRNTKNIAHVTIEVNSVQLFRLMKSILVGDKCQTKYLRSDFLSLPVNKLRAFLRGWEEGDGCKTEGRMIVVTTCKDMAIQAGIMYAKIGKPYSIGHDDWCNTKNIKHSKKYRVTTRINTSNKQLWIIKDSFILRKIYSSNTSIFSGTVYNFEVKNRNSYVVQSVGVHNSVNRNQPRKRLDAILQVMQILKRDYGNLNIKCHFHCCLKDRLGWNLLWLARYYNVLDVCIFDKNLMPGIGPSDEAMNEIVNCYDLHISLANSEGWGLTSIETAAAGIPNIALDYSAIGDWGKNAFLLIKPAAYEHESRTGFVKAIADIHKTAQSIKLLATSPKLRQDYADKALRLGQRLDWGKICKEFWEPALDSISIDDLAQNRWTQLKLDHRTFKWTNIPEDPTTTEFELPEV